MKGLGKSVVKDIDRWNEIARDYRQWLGTTSDSGGHAFAQALLTAIGQRLPKARNAAVLDLGCGEGSLFAELRRRYDSVIGFDGSLSMIELGRRQALDLGVACVVGDLMEPLPFLSGSFDVVVSNMVLMSVEHVDVAFAEVARILRDNGVFLFTINHPCFSFARHHLGSGQHRYLEQFRSARPLGSAFDHACTSYHRPLQFYVERALHGDLYLRSFEEICVSAASTGLDPGETVLRAYYMTANAVLFETIKAACPAVS